MVLSNTCTNDAEFMIIFLEYHKTESFKLNIITILTKYNLWIES